MRVLVCGDRNWSDGGAILRELKKLRTYPDVVIIHGAARGADRLGGKAAEVCGFEVEVYPAQWELYGCAAGPIRNKQMLDEGKPELVLAFHEDLSKSKGTAHMVKIASKAGIPVKTFSV